MAKRQLRKRRTSKEKKVLVVNKNKKNKSKGGSKSATSAADTPQGDSPRRLELAAHQELISDEAEQAKEVVVVVKENSQEEGVNSHQTPKKTTGPAAAALDKGGFHLLRRSGKETVVVLARLSPPPSPSVNSPPPPPPTSPATSSFYSPTSSPSPSFNSPPSPSPSPATSSFFSTSTPLPPSPSSKTTKPTVVVAQEEVDWEIVAIFDVSSKTAAAGKSTAPRKKYLVGWKNSNNSSAVDYTASWVSESQLASGCKALLDLFNAHQQAFEEWKRTLSQLGFHCFQCALHRCHQLVLEDLKEAGESLLAEQLKSLFSEAEPDWLSEKTKPAEKSKKAKPKPKPKMKMKKVMMKKEKEKEEKKEAKSQLLLKMKLLFAATKLADTLVAVNVKMKSEDPGDTTSDLVEGSDELYGVEDYRRLIGWQLKELQKLQ